MVSLRFRTRKSSSDRDAGCHVATVIRNGLGRRLGTWRRRVSLVVSETRRGSGSGGRGSTVAGSEAGADGGWVRGSLG